MTDPPWVKERRLKPAVLQEVTDDGDFFLLIVDSRADIIVGSVTMDQSENHFRANYHPEDHPGAYADLGTWIDMYMAYWTVRNHHEGR